jgi:hypothetical protein
MEFVLQENTYIIYHLLPFSYDTGAYNKLDLEFEIAMFTMSTQYTHGLHNHIDEKKMIKKKQKLYNYT